MKKSYIVIAVFLSLIFVIFIQIKKPKINSIVLGQSIDKIKTDWSIKELIGQYPDFEYIFLMPVYKGSKYGISADEIESIIKTAPKFSGKTIMLDKKVLYNVLLVYPELGISVVFMHGKVSSIHAQKAATYYYDFFMARYTIKNTYSGSYKGKIKIGTSKEVVEELLGPLFNKDGWYNYKYGGIEFNYDYTGLVSEIIVKGGSSD